MPWLIIGLFLGIVGDSQRSVARRANQTRTIRRLNALMEHAVETKHVYEVDWNTIATNPRRVA